MGDSSIIKNMVIEWTRTENQEAGLSRLLWIDEKRTAVAIYMLTGKQAFPIIMDYSDLCASLEAREAVILPIDPFAVSKLDGRNISEKMLCSRDKNWEIIKDMVCEEPAIYFEESRGKFVRKAVQKTGVQKKYIYKFLRRYWERGMVKNSLLPDFQKRGGFKQEKLSKDIKRGRPSNVGKINPEKNGINITDVEKALIRLAIDKYYNTEKKHAIKEAYDLMCEYHYNKGFQSRDGVKVPITAPPEKCPTYYQFHYWLKKYLNHEKSIKARKGERVFNLTSRPVLDESTRFAFGPGHIYQIDSTIADIYLLSSFLRTQIIGRPVLYLVVDVFSRLVVGFYAGLEGPSWIGGAMALAVTAMNKVEFCSQFGISIQPGDWPVDVFPRKLVADRGPEWIGNASDKLINNFNVAVMNTPPYRADFKGIVEKQFHKVNVDTIKWIPGAVTERFRERGERDCRLDATLTLPEFTEVLIRMILNYNNNHYLEEYPLLPEMVADGVKPVPVELWNWGMRNRTGYLQRRTQQETMIGLMPSGQATVSWQGIKFQGLHYTCERALQEGWYVQARASKSWKCMAFFDPRKLERIYLQPLGEKEPIECRLLEKDTRFSEYFLEDLQELQALKKTWKREHEHQQRQGVAEQRAHIGAVVKRARERNKLAGECFESDIRRTKAIGENRKVERVLLAGQEAFNPAEGSPLQIGWNGESENDKCSESILSDPSYSKKHHRLELLKNSGKGGITGNACK